MCGIFGLIRCPNASRPTDATEAFVLLGELAVERGRDASGFALSKCSNTRATKLPVGVSTETETIVDDIFIAKACSPFTDLFDDTSHRPLIDAATVAMGHTRWATQGAAGDLLNASPLIAGNLIATHNGDVDMATLPAAARKEMVGKTDTEALFLALANISGDRRKIRNLLVEMRGRAALAWLDRGRQNRVYLARAGLSPLAIASDADGNFWWASNPRWFRDADDAMDGAIGFRNITLVPEGTLLTLTVGEKGPVISDRRTFKPTVRASDMRIADLAVWRGFDDADRAADKSQANRNVHASTTASYAGYSSGYAGSAYAAYGSTPPGTAAVGSAAKYEADRKAMTDNWSWKKYDDGTEKYTKDKLTLDDRLAAEEADILDDIDEVLGEQWERDAPWQDETWVAEADAWAGKNENPYGLSDRDDPFHYNADPDAFDPAFQEALGSY